MIPMMRRHASRLLHVAGADPENAVLRLRRRALSGGRMREENNRRKGRDGDDISDRRTRDRRTDLRRDFERDDDRDVTSSRPLSTSSPLRGAASRPEKQETKAPASTLFILLIPLRASWSRRSVVWFSCRPSAVLVKSPSRSDNFILRSLGTSGLSRATRCFWSVNGNASHSGCFALRKRRSLKRTDPKKMLSQLCRAQLWPKPSRKWSRHFPRGIRRKLGQGHVDVPNIVHFNCSTNNLQGITDHCSDNGGDSSCCSDEENYCSSGDFDDTCSEYSCTTSMPFSRECCCCCQAAENPAYGLSTLHPHAPQYSPASDTTLNNLENYHQQGENDYIPLWGGSREPNCESTFKIIPHKAHETTEVTATASRQPSTGHGPVCHSEDDDRKTVRLRGVLSDRDSPSAFRVVVPKPIKKDRSHLQVAAAKKETNHIEKKQTMPTVDPLSLRVMPDPTLTIQNKKPEGVSLKKHSVRHGNLKRFSICEADGILQRASPQNPAQVPMVVMQCARLHLSLSSSPPFQQTSLPMGTLVTALYRQQDWICVQTPHGVTGYLFYTNCTPFGILPASKKLEPWETLSWNQREDASQSTKKSNVRLQGRNRENGMNKVRRLSSGGGKQAKVVYPSKTNVENVRATLQRNLASRKPSPDTGRRTKTEKVVEKNIDKLISTTTSGLAGSGSELAAALKMLRLDGTSVENGHSGTCKT